MDRKTLKYMEERSKKAREVVSRIDELEVSIENVMKAEKVVFMGFEYNIRIEENRSDFIEDMIATYIGSAVEEIKQLEQELAEL